MASTMASLDESVLLVEDDASLRLALQIALRAEGFRVRTASNGRVGLDEMRKERPGLVLLDVMMPELNGFEVLAEIRREDAQLAVILLTAKGAEEDRVRGLKLGADDYIVKPFAMAEFLARVHAAFRRTRAVRKQVQRLAFGAALVDFERHQATCAGVEVELTALEFKLLLFLAENEGRVLSRARIVDAVWGADYFGTERTVDKFVTRLRQKLEPSNASPQHFLTVRGAGYRFCAAVTKP
jgi:DNA-binding response OmpR family regulator